MIGLRRLVSDELVFVKCLHCTRFEAAEMLQNIQLDPWTSTGSRFLIIFWSTYNFVCELSYQKNRILPYSIGLLLMNMSRPNGERAILSRAAKLRCMCRSSKLVLSLIYLRDDHDKWVSILAYKPCRFITFMYRDYFLTIVGGGCAFCDNYRTAWSTTGLTDKQRSNNCGLMQ